MPVDPDISQSTTGGDQPGFEPDRDSSRTKSKKQKKQEIEDRYDKTMDSYLGSARSGGPNKIQTAKAVANVSGQLFSHPKTVLGAQFKRTLAQANMPAGQTANSKDFSLMPGKHKFNPLEDSPISGGGAENKGKKKKNGPGLPGTPGSQPDNSAKDGAGYNPKTASADGVIGGAGKSAMSGGAGAATDAKGVGGGKAQAAQAAAQGAQAGLNKIRQGDFKGGIKEGLEGAVSAAGSVAADRLWWVLLGPQFLVPTIGLSIIVGWNVLWALSSFIKYKGVKVSLQFYQKGLIVLMDAILAFLALLLIVVLISSFCYSISGDYKSRIISLVTSTSTAVIGEAIRFNAPPELISFCENITNSTGSTGARGYNSNTPYNPSAGVAQWKTLIEAAAQKTDVEPCIIQAIIEQESGGKPNAASTFYPGGGTGPSYYDLDKREPNTPFEGYYNLDWVGQGHAIGLMQISIYSQTSDGWASNSNGQPDKVPARNPKLGMMPASYVTKYNLQEYYTVSDLRDPQKNIDIGSVYIRYLIDLHKGNIERALGDYYGKFNAPYPAEVRKRIENCRARANLP